ncbi:DUF3347 domain-containing protein [Lutibacter sp.]|uniref:DUF3347 domain-containing protein n=1 Tax=Lutibacter sp. TaxID=1925666 RepID=UPI0025BA2ADB|nr:DUF3347 domain-containing protein [Lutibacter sp.]MCF6181183.1 DUF3347 domain-containing protein [Lutibacter sp.]
MKKTIYVLVLSALFLTACKNDKKQTEPSSGNKQSKEMNIKEADGHDHGDHDHDATMGENSSKEKRNIDATTQKNNATSTIIDSYLQIKNALVNDNKDEAAKGGNMMLTAFSNFDMSKLSETQHKEYMEIIEDAKEQAEHIIKSPIDHQREHFENLSVDINDLISLLGTSKTLYQNKCPMAGEGKGAIWLSEYKEIKNPFFGSKMIKCGSVQKQIN